MHVFGSVPFVPICKSIWHTGYCSQHVSGWWQQGSVFRWPRDLFWSAHDWRHPLWDAQGPLRNQRTTIGTETNNHITTITSNSSRRLCVLAQDACGSRRGTRGSAIHCLTFAKVSPLFLRWTEEKVSRVVVDTNKKLISVHGMFCLDLQMIQPHKYWRMH